MKKKVLTAVLLTASIFGFGNYTNASGEPGYEENYGYMTPISNTFSNTSYVSYTSCEETLYLEDNYPNLKNKINNILKKVEYKLRNKTNQQKIQFYERLSKKISEIGNRLTVKNLNYFILVDVKCDIYSKISTLKKNNPNVLNDLFGNIDDNSNNNVNNNISNTNQTQTYKIYGAQYTKNINIDYSQNTLTKVKLGIFDISSSYNKSVFINNFGVKFIEANRRKISSIKYVKVVDANGNILSNLNFSSSGNYDIVFDTKNISLKPGKYTIIGDISDIGYGTRTIKTILFESYSYDSKLISKNINFGKINIFK